MHGLVVEWIGSRIASGHLTGVLDLEDIARRFHVSRSLVRECLRTLAAKGMVQARRRTGTRVTNPEQWAVLDEQVIRWRASGPYRFVQLQESLQLRQRVEPLAARLMAEQGTEAGLARLHRAVTQLEKAIADEDEKAAVDADTAFHRELYLSSGNAMLGGLAGIVHACLRVPDFEGRRKFSMDTVNRHRRLAELVATRDADGAEQAAEHLMTLSTTLFLRAYEHVLEQAVSGQPAHTTGR